MVALRFEIDYGFGYQVVQPPKNWKEMRIQLIFDKPELQAQLQSIVFEFVKDTAKNLRSYFRNGLTGGPGILEGPGLRIFAGNGALPLNIFDGCIDTADEDFLIDADIVKAPIKESGKIDWLNDSAQSFTFEYLTSNVHDTKPWHITSSDYAKVPYCISTIPNYTQALLLSVTLFLMVKEAVDIICKIESFIARMIGQGLSWFQLVMTIVELVLYSIYLYVIINAAAKLMQQILDAIVQQKKIKLGMREQDLWKKGCLYLGLTFSSSIYGVNAPDDYGGRYVNALLIPKKITIPDGDLSLENYLRPPSETAPDSYGYYEGTFKQFIDDMCTTYHAKAVIIKDPVTGASTLSFEEKNKFNKTSPFKLPNEGVVGYTYNYPQPYGTNAREIPAVYIVQFQKDEQDTNTYQNYQGTYAIAQTVPNIVRNQKNQLLNGSVNVQIPFALARRKTSLLKIEKEVLNVLESFNGFINGVFSAFDRINAWTNEHAPGGFDEADNEYAASFAVGLFTGQPLFSVAALVFSSDGLAIFPTTNYDYTDDRIGWMLLSSDFIGVPKRLIGLKVGDDYLVDPNNQATTITTNTSITTTIDPATINGFFQGMFVSAAGPSFMVHGEVAGGFIAIASGFGPIAGPTTGVATGTITGFPGITFTVTLSGVVTGVSFTGSGTIDPVSLTSDGEAVDNNTSAWASALSLMTDFHSQELIDNNQWLVFKDKTFKMLMQDFNQINYNNIFTTADGKLGKFDSLVWDIYNDKAISVNYRIKEKYTTNYTTTYKSDGG